MRWNKIANLTQNVELGTDWLDALFLHPCLVAGLTPQANSLLQKTVGGL
jgi:hypothetical protein